MLYIYTLIEIGSIMNTESQRQLSFPLIMEPFRYIDHLMKTILLRIFVMPSQTEQSDESTLDDVQDLYKD